MNSFFLWAGPVPEPMTTQPPFTSAEYGMLCAGSALGLALLRVVLNAFLFKPIARRAVLSAKERQLPAPPAKRLGTVDKFCESVWKLGVYTALWCTEAWALHDKGWLWDTRQYWEGMPAQPQSARVALLYCVQTGFYACSILMLRSWETRRKDHPVMMAHHWTTLTLLAASWHFGWQRIGSAILLLHDTSDVLLEAAKLLNYAGREAASAAVFVAMAVSWFCLRLLLFPRHVIYSSMFEYQQVHGRPIDHYWPMNGMLLALLAMHAYWFSLIVKVAIRSLQGELKDVREDDDQPVDTRNSPFLDTNDNSACAHISARAHISACPGPVFHHRCI